MKIDFHVHTTHSPDSLSTPERIIRAAVRKGIDAIAITNHDTFEGVEQAKLAAKKLAPKLLVIAGEEFFTDKGDLLGLFLKKPIKAKRGEKFEKVAKEIHRQGGIAIAAHPFDRVRKSRFKLETLSKKQLQFLDAIEAYNSRTAFWEDNEKALSFASEHKLPAIAGSDSHFPHELGTCSTRVFAKSEAEIKRQILKGECAVDGSHSRPRPWILHALTNAVIHAKRSGIA